MKFKEFWKSTKKPESDKPTIFSMTRRDDESGHSGVGHVLDGVIFPSGKVVVCWDPIAPEGKATVEGKAVNSIAIFDSWEAFTAIHIDQHPGNGTSITFLN